MPSNPPSNAHGFAMRSMSLRDMQIPKSKKKILGPPLPNPGDAPGLAGAVVNVADSNGCNPKVPSSIPALGKDFPWQESLIT